MTARITLTGISFKEVLVLLYFVETENTPTHATGIEKKLKTMNINVLLPKGSEPASISRRWSRITCEKLVNDGLLTYNEQKVWRQKSLVKFYHLIESLEMLKKLIPRVMPLFGTRLIDKTFVQKIIENELLNALEKHYKVHLDEDTWINIFTLVFSSTRAFELAIRLLEIPLDIVKTNQERNIEIGNTLVGVLLAALITDLTEGGLRWREELFEKVTVHMSATIKIGDVKDTIESTLDFVSNERPRVLDLLKTGSSQTTDKYRRRMKE